jgi:hypothetical protein
VQAVQREREGQRETTVTIPLHCQLKPISGALYHGWEEGGLTIALATPDRKG